MPLDDLSARRSLMALCVTGSLLTCIPASFAEQMNLESEPLEHPAATAPMSPGAPAVSQLLGSSLSQLPELGANFSTFNLENGLEVVVIPDHRAPVVTHMIWYKVGAADEKPGVSGIAHFLEHLMFKGTEAHPDGTFSKIVASLGGEENAFTSQDYTAYYQRVAKQHLSLMMEMEADRMANLELRDDQVTPEREVILEERVSRIDNDPSAQLGEALSAALYRNHPYGIPIIGWEHEMMQLDRQKALAFYNEYYTPNNAILIVAGDVTEDEVRELANETYGKLAKRADPKPRVRPSEPPQRTARTLTLRHERVTQPSIRRAYSTPSDTTAKGTQAQALELLTYILGSGTNSRFYKSLVVDQKIASSAGAYYQSATLDDTNIMLYGSPSGKSSVDDLLGAMKFEIERLIADGISEKELSRAKRALLAQTFYAQDNQASLARIVGVALTTGQSLDAIRSWPSDLASVTDKDIISAAKTYLQEHRSVTGYLLPPQAKLKAAKTRADGHALPKDRKMASPKTPPRTSIKVPSPQSRPQGQPKAKPAQVTAVAPTDTEPTKANKAE